MSPLEDDINGEGRTASAEERSLPDLFESLDLLKSDLKEFTKIKEGIKVRLSSITQLVPRLNAQRELLEKDVAEKRKGFQQLNFQVPKLNEQKETLVESIAQKQKHKELLETSIHLEQEKVQEITIQISKLAYDRTEIEKSIHQKEEEISEIDGQIREIESIQEHGIDLISTLVYASKKAS